MRGERAGGWDRAAEGMRYPEIGLRYALDPGAGDLREWRRKRGGKRGRKGKGERENLPRAIEHKRYETNSLFSHQRSRHIDCDV